MALPREDRRIKRPKRKSYGFTLDEAIIEALREQSVSDQRSLSAELDFVAKKYLLEKGWEFE